MRKKDDTKISGKKRLLKGIVAGNQKTDTLNALLNIPTFPYLSSLTMEELHLLLRYTEHLEKIKEHIFTDEEMISIKDIENKLQAE